MAVALQNSQVEKALDSIVAESCVNIAQLNVASLDEVKKGKTLFESKLLDKYQWNYSSSFLVSTNEKLEQDVATLARAKHWSPEFSNKVVDLAKLTVKDDEIQIKFCTDSSSGVELAIIASYKGDNGTHYLKVMRIDTVFNLAPNVQIKILEDSEPVYVTLKSGLSIMGFSVEHEHIKKAGDKIHQRIEKVVIPQKATGGEFESMQKYLVFRLCQTASRRYLNTLDIDEETRNMLQWDGSS